MAVLEVTVQQILGLIEQLSQNDKQSAFEKLRERLDIERASRRTSNTIEPQSLSKENDEPAECSFSMREIVKSPIPERHEILEQYIPTMAEDYALDPALTEFTELDLEDCVEEDTVT